MKRQTITVSIILVCALALAAYIHYGRASTHSEEAGTSKLQAPPHKLPAQQQEPPPPPPPPRFPGDPPCERKPTPQAGSLPLTLSVLAREGNALRTLVSRQFAGGVLFRIRLDDAFTYLAARDLTGDGRPEIIVAPATGASVGGWLEVLSFDGSTLHELARIGGHFFRVRSKGAGKPALITARWNGEEGTRSYQWNGQGFEETAKPVKESR